MVCTVWGDPGAAKIARDRTRYEVTCGECKGKAGECRKRGQLQKFERDPIYGNGTWDGSV